MIRRMDNVRLEEVLEFWFAGREQNELSVDARMNGWFGSDPAFDARSLRAAVAAEPLYADALPALSFRTEA